MSEALFSRTTQAYAQHKNVYPCDKQKHHVLIMCHAHYILVALAQLAGCLFCGVKVSHLVSQPDSP